MDVAYELLEVALLLADDGLEAVLKQVAVTAVALVEVDDIAGQKPVHAHGDGLPDGFAEQVEVVAHQRPGVDVPGAALRQCAEPCDEIVAVRISQKDVAPFDSPPDDVVQHPRRIYSRTSRHRVRIPNHASKVKQFEHERPLSFDQRELERSVRGCVTPQVARVRGSGKKQLSGPDRRRPQSSMREDAETIAPALVDGLNPELRYLRCYAVIRRPARGRPSRCRRPASGGGSGRS